MTNDSSRLSAQLRHATRGIAWALLALLTIGIAASAAHADELAINVLSNRADLISGGDALVQVVVPADVAVPDVHVTLNGSDVTSVFGIADDGRFLGLVDGMNVGDNEVEANVTPPTTKQAAAIIITNAPIGGPVFSGAQLLPFICARKTATSVVVTVPNTALSGMATTRVSGLDADPVDDQCNAPSKFTFYYEPVALQGGSCTFTTPLASGSCFSTVYDLSSPPAPSAIADFTNDRGDTVKAIIVVERGTVDRGLYELTTFYDPTMPNTPQHRAAVKGWNNKLLWSFGVASGPRRFEEPPKTSEFNANALSKGYMSASGSLTDHDTNLNDTLGAEFLMMVKEQIAENYGEIRYTVGAGCSGGSLLQYNIAAAYPGMVQGIQPNCTFPDTVTTAIEVVDCGLLSGRYYTVAPGNALTTAKRTAINGHLNANDCPAWVSSFLGFGNPKTASNCGSGFPTSITYDPSLRPQGVRCSSFDHDVSMLGTFVDTDGNTKANSPLDNVGVQYGLKALAAGTITPEEFVALNENVGSYSADLVYGPQRGAVALSTLHTVYSAGLVSDGAQLAKTAIIDLRGQEGSADIHLNWRAFSVRARLDNANGNHDNQVIWASGPGIAAGAATSKKSFLTMDQWLATIEADHSNTPLPAKIVAAKPAAAHDLCINSTGATDAQVAAELPGGLTDPNCPVKFLNEFSPRQVAGGPRSEDVFKCQLKPLDFNSADYNGAVFDSGQQGRLQAAFPNGVCDWTLPGVGKVPSDGGSTFKNGPGGEPLGAAPTSETVEPTCGDGDVIGEVCDDGNTTSGDGCSSTCTVEAGFTCEDSPSVCSPICGDDLVRGGEACDDGNTTNGDGCSSTCTVETGYLCSGDPSVCNGICGDGLIRGAEACDDGNVANGDGCSSTCAIEQGYTCTGNTSTCSPICGDGLVRGSETCDDGNTAASDGCSDTCATETGFACSGEPSTCNGICGDGLIRGAEACDDGNVANGDGCSSTCTTETGYTCSGNTSVCSPICGDGLVLGGEACDDGNVTNGDGCSSTCTIETGFHCSGQPSACDGICGDGLIKGTEACDDAEANGTATSCCSASCHFNAGGTSCDDGNACTTNDQCSGTANSCVGGAPPDCNDHNACTADSCNPATGCVNDAAARNGFACNDGDVCTQGDVCTNGSCAGTDGADSDNDGYCDDQETAAGCNPNDSHEIPPQALVFPGKPVNGLGNILVTFLTPTDGNVPKATDPSCATAGVCSSGFCTAGKIADACTTNADCNQPAGTCRVVANYADTPDLAVRKPFMLNHTDVTASFQPLTPGCSRKVDVTLDPSRHVNTLKINVTGTVGGHVRRDADNFKFK